MNLFQSKGFPAQIASYNQSYFSSSRTYSENILSWNLIASQLRNVLKQYRKQNSSLRYLNLKAVLVIFWSLKGNFGRLVVKLFPRIPGPFASRIAIYLFYPISTCRFIHLVTVLFLLFCWMNDEIRVDYKAMFHNSNCLLRNWFWLYATPKYLPFLTIMSFISHTFCSIALFFSRKANL